MARFLAPGKSKARFKILRLLPYDANFIDTSSPYSALSSVVTPHFYKWRPRISSKGVRRWSLDGWKSKSGGYIRRYGREFTMFVIMISVSCCLFIISVPSSLMVYLIALVYLMVTDNVSVKLWFYTIYHPASKRDANPQRFRGTAGFFQDSVGNTKIFNIKNQILKAMCFTSI